jgi:MFS family permease
LVTTGYTCFIIAMTMGRLFGDKLIGRFGPIRMLMVNGMLMSAGFLLSAIAPYFITAALAFIIIGIGDSIIVPIVYSLTAKTKKMPPGYAISAVTLIGYSGFLSGPILIGSLSEWLGMQWAFAVISVFGLAITLLAVHLKGFREIATA